jgi:hypothetical protein
MQLLTVLELEIKVNLCCPIYILKYRPLAAVIHIWFPLVF